MPGKKLFKNGVNYKLIRGTIERVIISDLRLFSVIISGKQQIGITGEA